MPRGTQVVTHGGSSLSPTGLSPSIVGRSRPLRLETYLPSGYLQPSDGNPYNPRNTTPACLHAAGLGSSRFARRYSGNRYLFLFLAVLRCFSSRGSPPCPMCSDRDARALPPAGFPIRASPDQRLLAATRGVSSLATPFIGSRRQGIHHAPFVA